MGDKATYRKTLAMDINAAKGVLPVISSYVSKAQQDTEALRTAHQKAEERYQQARKSGEAFNDHSPAFNKVWNSSNAVREASDRYKKLQSSAESAGKMIGELETVKSKFGLLSREMTKEQAAKTVVELQNARSNANNMQEIPDKAVKAAYEKVGKDIESIKQELIKKYGLTKKDIAVF